jgi:hypothetical protein
LPLRGSAGSSFDQFSIIDFAKSTTAETKEKTFLLLFVSTTGDGEQVDAMQATWKLLYV